MMNLLSKNIENPFITTSGRIIPELYPPLPLKFLPSPKNYGVVI